jgi:hypothetical protein
MFYRPPDQSQTPNRSPGQAAPPESYASAAGLANGYSLAVVPEIGLLGYLAWRAIELLNAPRGAAWDADVHTFALELPLFGPVVGGLMLLGWVVFTMWIQRLVANLPALGASAADDPPWPGVSATNSLVPVFNLFSPYHDIRKALHYTAASGGDGLDAGALAGASQGLALLELAVVGAMLGLQWSPENLMAVVALAACGRIVGLAASVAMVRTAAHQQDARAQTLEAQRAGASPQGANRRPASGL